MYIYNLGLLFTETAKKHAGKRALFFPQEEQVITYDELEKNSNRLAHFLIKNFPETRPVIIPGVKHPFTFITILAALKAGFVYSVTDPENPLSRFDKILETCQPAAIAADNTFISNHHEVIEKCRNVKHINLYSEAFQDELRHYPERLPEETIGITGSHPAYIMFTSGSTGVPKGAVMSHNNVLNFIKWSSSEFNITPDDTFSNVNPLYFDNSVFDIYSSLFTGASLVPVSKEIINDLGEFIRVLDKSNCTVWFSVPSLLIYLQTLKVFKKENFTTLRKVIFGGEGYPKPKLKKLFDLYSDRIEFFNVYGPTECTCICSSYKITGDDFRTLDGFPPLGKLIPNFSGLILDENMEKVRDGETGELCLLGPCVGLGYYNDQTRTRERFISNPHNSYVDEKMYITGDLCRFVPSENKIHILGRKDNQIKYMGYRIELEEIEVALAKLSYVNQAVVIHSVNSGFSRIKAVIETEGMPEIEKLRQDLSELIPGYMIPTDFIAIENLPKNANGKVDRKTLKEKYS